MSQYHRIIWIRKDFWTFPTQHPTGSMVTFKIMSVFSGPHPVFKLPKVKDSTNILGIYSGYQETYTNLKKNSSYV